MIGAPIAIITTCGKSATRATPNCGTADPRVIQRRPYLVHFVHQVHLVHCQRRASAARIPPPPSSCPHTLRSICAPSHSTQRHRQPTGYSKAPPSCPFCPSGLLGPLPAPCLRSPHTPAAIKQPAYPAVDLHPSHSTQRHRQPTGYSKAPPSCPFGPSGPLGPLPAPRLRSPHTPAAIKQPALPHTYAHALARWAVFLRKKTHFLLKMI